MIFGSEKRPTHSVPKTPLARWTDVAPTGSSILILSNPMTDTTTSTPAIAPMTTDEATLTYAHGAVIATSPARQPLSVMPRSGFPSKSHAVTVAVSVATAPAVFVTTATSAMKPGSAAIVLPGLNPNHPSQSRSEEHTSELQSPDHLGCSLMLH